MLKKLKELIVWWERKNCYADMEYYGDAIFGNCCGCSIWGDGKLELKELCKGCKYLYKEEGHRP